MIRFEQDGVIDFYEIGSGSVLSNLAKRSCPSFNRKSINDKSSVENFLYSLDKWGTKLQVILKKYDILLIADEVICGFGRTGNYWGCETYNINPDMIACAKGLSSAYLPISALLVSDEIYQTMKKLTI